MSAQSGFSRMHPTGFKLVTIALRGHRRLSKSSDIPLDFIGKGSGSALAEVLSFRDRLIAASWSF
jgi:hypothetical protein